MCPIYFLHLRQRVRFSHIGNDAKIQGFAKSEIQAFKTKARGRWQEHAEPGVLHCILFMLLCTLFMLLCTLFMLLCILFMLHCILFMLFCTLFMLQSYSMSFGRPDERSGNVLWRRNTLYDNSTACYITLLSSCSTKTAKRVSKNSRKAKHSKSPLEAFLANCSTKTRING